MQEYMEQEESEHFDGVMSRDTERLIDKQPKPLIQMRVCDPKTEDWESTVARICCYLLQHKDAFDKLWASKKNAMLEDLDVLIDSSADSRNNSINDIHQMTIIIESNIRLG